MSRDMAKGIYKVNHQMVSKQSTQMHQAPNCNGKDLLYVAYKPCSANPAQTPNQKHRLSVRADMVQGFGAKFNNVLCNKKHMETQLILFLVLCDWLCFEKTCLITPPCLLSGCDASFRRYDGTSVGLLAVNLKKKPKCHVSLYLQSLRHV